MDSEQLRLRCRQFTLEVVDLCATLGSDDLARVIRPQLLRAATGLCCNQRASRRARSRKEFVSRLAVVVEEADEAEFWLDLCVARQRGAAGRAAALKQEAVELTAIFARARSTALEGLKRRRE